MTDEQNYRQLSAEKLSDFWGTLTKYVINLRRRDGSWQRQVREVYDHGNGVACLLYNPETDCVLLTKQFRLPAYLNGAQSFMIEVPAGLLEGEAALEQMRAELMEETGHQIAELDYLFNLYMSPGSLTESISFFRGIYAASDKVGAGGGVYEEGEDIEVLHIPLRDALAMIESGEICDAKTVILLQRFLIENSKTCSSDR